jgi:hypothetical protein
MANMSTFSLNSSSTAAAKNVLRIKNPAGQLEISQPDIDAPYIDWDGYKKCILALLSRKSFFKRFTNEQLQDNL